MQVRHCPECDTEFLAHVERCSDCGGPLVDRVESEEEDQGAPADGESEAPDRAAADALRLELRDCTWIARRDTAAELDEMGARLAEAGIPYRVEVASYTFRLGVRPKDGPAALMAIRDLITAESGAESEVAEGQPQAYAQCPACEAALPEGARACPECGLQLAGDEESPYCRMCGANVEDETKACPHCAYTPPE